MSSTAGIEPNHAARTLEEISSKCALLRADALRSDNEGRLSTDVVDILRRSGAFRLTADPALGGFGTGVGTVVEVASGLARLHPSAAWNVVVSNSHAATSQSFRSPATAAEGALAADLLFCGSYGRNEATLADGDGHFVLNGTWRPASNALHAEWATVDARHPGHGRVFLIVPMDELVVERSWNVIGMRGTGSETIHAIDALVPADHVLAEADFEVQGRSTNLSLRIPKPFRTSLGLAAVGIGATLGFAQEVAGKSARVTPSGAGLMPGADQTTSADLPLALTVAVNRAEGAEDALEALADRVDTAARADEARQAKRLTQWRTDLSRIVRDAVDALHELSLLADSMTAHDGTYPGMLWRDGHVALRHGTLSVQRGYAGGANLIRARYGVPEPTDEQESRHV